VIHIACSTFLSLVCFRNYCEGLLLLCAKNLFWEGTITLVLPTLIIGIRGTWQGVFTRLVIIETAINLTAILARWSARKSFGFPLRWSLLVLIFCQTIGFVWNQLDRKLWVSAASTVILGSTLLVHIFTGRATVRVKKRKETTMWNGQPTDFKLRIIYLLWVLQVLWQDYALCSRKLLFAYYHIASLWVSMSKSDFFQARLLTACHGIVFTKLMDWLDPSLVSSYFAVLPESWILSCEALGELFSIISFSGLLLISFLYFQTVFNARESLSLQKSGH